MTELKSAEKLVYVVMGRTGEYSDRPSNGGFCAYEDFENAKAEVLRRWLDI